MSKRIKTNNQVLWDRACNELGINVNRHKTTHPKWSVVNSYMTDLIWDIQKHKQKQKNNPVHAAVMYEVPPDRSIIDDKKYAIIPEDAVPDKTCFFGYKHKDK